MSAVRLTIVYYSTYGHNLEMASIAADAARHAGAEVRLRKVKETAPEELVESIEPWRQTAERMANVPDVTNEDVEWANAYLISAPTRYGVVASQLRAWIDTLGPLWQRGVLANKPVTAMTSASNPHGGQETTLLGLYATVMHWGAVVVAPGYTDPSVYQAGGNPYGVTVTVGKGPISEEVKAAIGFQARRLVAFAAKLAA